MLQNFEKQKKVTVLDIGATEGTWSKLLGSLNENLQIDDIFGEYVAQWSQGNYDYDFADLKSGSVKGSLVDDFTLGPDE